MSNIKNIRVSAESAKDLAQQCSLLQRKLNGVAELSEDRNIKISTEVNAVGETRSIVWDSILVPNLNDGYAGIINDSESNKEISILRKKLISSQVRQSVIQFFNDLDTVSDVIAECCVSKSKIITQGQKVCSTTSILKTLTSLSPRLTYVNNDSSKYTIASIIRHMLSIHGLVADDNQIMIYQQTPIGMSVDDLSLVVSDMLIEQCLLLLPNQSSLKTAKFSSLELANDINIKLRKFLNELSKIESSKNDVLSFLGRLKSFILGTEIEDYGEESILFTKDSNFDRLSRNISLINLALKEGSNALKTNAILWKLEDERILRAIERLDKQSDFSLMSKTEFERCFWVRVANTSTYNDRKAVIIESKVGSVVRSAAYRKFRAGDQNFYQYDSRFDVLSQFSEVVAYAKWGCFSEVISSAVTSEDDMMLYTSGVSDEWIQALAAAKCSSLRVEKTTGDLCYMINSDKIPYECRNVIPSFLGHSIIKDHNLALFILAVDSDATHSIIEFKDDVEFKPNGKYKYTPNTMIELNHDSCMITTKQNWDKDNNIVVKVPVFKRITGSELGEFVYVVDRATIVRSIRFAKSFSIILDKYKSDKMIMLRAVRSYHYELSSMIKASESIAALLKNEMWFLAKDNKDLKSSLYSNRVFDAHMKIWGFQTLLRLTGLYCKDFDRIISEDLENLVSVLEVK